MKSFRLDPDSVDEVVEGWPFFLITIVVCLILAWLSTIYEWMRVLVPITLGVALGPRMFGELREKYPTAKQLWMLSTGKMVCLIGVIAWMAFPKWRGTSFDLCWLGVAFLLILGFVLINRRSKDVLT